MRIHSLEAWRGSSLPFQQRSEPSTLERVQGNRTLMRQDHSIFRRMDALKSHNLQDEVAER